MRKLIYRWRHGKAITALYWAFLIDRWSIVHVVVK